MSSPWYQFSLRSLLLFTLSVAILCSLGVCTNWIVSVFLGIVLMGGLVGRIVAGTAVGFAHGAVYGTLSALLAVSVTVVCGVFLAFVLRLWQTSPWLLATIEAIAVLIGVVSGGILGGMLARSLPKR